ncbi:MAG: AraC family transcriptional regulator ligand-binding domain-containing protein [Proteobacteria bacterium]|nr:AraC family transcriptional regulator ligand-binding domain-containing protein [Pseudomonadota bacterium]
MANPTLERLPMTMGYFRLIHRCFGGGAERSAAVLKDTGVSESDLRNPAAEISLFQQVRQVENVNALYGPGWAFSQPELWSPSAHGAIAAAMLSAPTLGDAIDVLRRYGHVRAPFFRMHIASKRDRVVLDYELSVALSEAQWRPMMEIAFVAVRSLIQAVLGRAPVEAEFFFAAPKPSYAEKVRSALGPHVSFDSTINKVVLPKEWMGVAATGADSALYRNALSELQATLARLDDPVGLHAQVERLLQTMPDGRLGADDVARALGVSRRTLTRRLSEAGTQFRDLLDGEIKARAENLLSSKKLSRDEIAERLGYRDPTSFSRACRRWFAKSANRA